MIVVGLTGSIGMGKSTAARYLRRLGVPVYEADAEVHKLYAKGGAAVAPIAKAFPAAVRAGAVDRARLSAILREAPEKVTTLEAIVHPLARQVQRRFLATAAMRRRPVAVLDIPLLFETRGERRCDAVALLLAPRMIQEARVLARPGMTREKLAGIRKRQMPDAEKRRRADFVVPTGLSKRESLKRLGAIVGKMRARAGRHWRPGAAGT